MTKRGAETFDIGDISQGDIDFRLCAINDTYELRDSLKTNLDPELVDKLEQRRALDQIITDLKKEHRARVNAIDGTADEHLNELLSDLEDPHFPIDPIQRTALLLPGMGGESLKNNNIRSSATVLAGQISSFNDVLVASNEPQPFINLTYIPGRLPGWYNDLHISYGATLPNTGLQFSKSDQEEVCDCGEVHYKPSNVLDIPVQDYSAVKPSIFSHEYFKPEEEVVSVNGFRSQLDAPNSRHFFRKEKNSIILPVGKIITEGAVPIINYDNGGVVKEITAGTHSLSWEQERTFSAVGNNAVRAASDNLLDLANKAYAENAYMKEMYRDIDRLVVTGIRRIVAKSTPYRRHRLHPR
jgi:hypothetical protein